MPHDFSVIVSSPESLVPVPGGEPSPLPRDDSSVLGASSAIISPPSRVVIMPKNVARIRGLNLEIQNDKPEDRDFFRTCFHHSKYLQNFLDKVPLYRREMSTDEDEQEARISISHDGNYATAVCIAVPLTWHEGPFRRFDRGTGRPIHKPLDSDKPLVRKYETQRQEKRPMERLVLALENQARLARGRGRLPLVRKFRIRSKRKWP